MYKRHRILWIDFVKGLCIFMVVFYHAIYFSNKTNLNNSNIGVLLKYLFDVLMMPCFFAVSGYLYKSVRNVKDYVLLIYKKLSSFVVPYIIFYFIFAIYYSKGYFHLQHIFSLFHIIFKPDGDLWFLQILLLIFIIVGILDLFNINQSIQFIFFFVLLLIFLIIIAPLIPHVHMILQFFNIIFFLMGRIIKKYTYYIKKYFVFVVILFCISFISMLFTTPFRYDAQFISLNTLIPKILGVFLIFAISMNVSLNNRLFIYFDKYGKYSLIIYIVHFIPVLIADYFLNSLTPWLLLNSVLVTFISWLVSIIICYMSKRLLIFNFIFYPRKYINKLMLKTRFGKRLLGD